MNRKVACEILTSGVCPLECEYCYIPKTPEMKKLHQKIVKSLNNGTFLSHLKNTYGDKLEFLGLWGTEPALTLDKITKILPQIKVQFPKLKQMAFSTNLMLGLEKIIDWVKVCDREKIDTDIQISLDGPAWITDEQRALGVTDRVTSNYAVLLKGLVGLKPKTKVIVRFKPTLNMKFIKILADDFDKTIDCLKFFDNLVSDGKRIVNKSSIGIVVSSAYHFTLVVPGKYTVEDGKILTRFFEVLHQVEVTEKLKNHKGSLNTYWDRWNRVGRYGHEFYTKSCMFTCSGGDSQVGLGIKGDMHICHRSYYLNYEEYRRSILGQEGVENWDVSLLKKGLLEKYVKNYIVQDDKEVARFDYVMRNYHDFTKLRMSSTNAMLIELALAGQASPIYLRSERIRILFSVFMNACMTCPVENLLNTGVVHLTPISLIRLFANGAFETILKYHCKEAVF